MPAQIPVKMALEKVAAEHTTDVKAMQQIAKAIASAKDNAGAQLTMQVARDTKRIAATTMALQGKSLDMFVKTISADPVTAGFKPEVVRLSGEEWSVLYSYLQGLGKEKKS